MKKFYKNKKILGFIIIVITIIIILNNKNWRLEHPVASFLFVWCSIPTYLFLIIKNNIVKTPVKEKPLILYDEPININDNKEFPLTEKVSHIEKKTVITTIESTSETIYFEKNKI